MKSFFNPALLFLYSFLLLLSVPVLAQVPANDLKENAAPIGPTTSCNAFSYQGSYRAYDLTNATGTPKDVWYKFVAGTTDYQISYLYTSYVKFEVSSTDAGAYASSVSSDGVFNVSKTGATYYIRLYSTSTSNQSGVFCFYTSVANDEKEHALPIVDGACISNGYAFNNATQSAQAFPCTSESSYSDIWYSFIPHSSSYNIQANTNTGFTFAMQVTDQADNPIACGSGMLTAGIAKANVTLTDLIPGNTYYIRLMKYSSNADIAMNVCISYVTVAPTVSLANISKTYADAPFHVALTTNSPGAVTYSITSGDDYATITPTGQVTIIKPGTVTIKADQAEAPGYTSATVSTTLTIDKAPLTVKAADQSKVYNTANPALTFTYTGLINEDIPGIHFTEPTISSEVTTSTDPGTYPILLSGGNADNYALNLENGTFTVDKITPTITYTGSTSDYRNNTITLSATTNSTNTISYSVANGTGQAHLSGNNLILDTPGEVTLTVSVASNTYYNTASVTPSITIIPVITPTITFEAIPNKLFTDDPFQISATSNSPAPITYTISESDSELATCTPEGLVTILQAGRVTVYARQAALPGYNEAEEVTSFNITLLDPHLVYTGPTNAYVGNPVTMAYTSLSDTPVWYSIANGNNFTTSGDQVTPLVTGTVVVRITQPNTAPYSYGYTYAYLQVSNPTPPQISLADIEKTYGDAPFVWQPTSNSSGAYTYSITSGNEYADIDASTGTVTIKGTGTVNVKVNQAGAGAYSASSVTASLLIKKASLTIEADHQTRAYGESNPELTLHYTGLAYNETGAVLTSQPVVSTVAALNSNTGNYPIEVSGGAADNYIITLGNGTLTVEKADPRLTYTGITTGLKEDQIILSASSLSNGLPSFNLLSTGTGTASLNENTLTLINEGTVDVEISLAEEDNYTAASIIQTITVSWPLGIDNNETVQVAKVYPNPAEDHVTVELTHTNGTNGKLALYDLTGNMICLIAEGDLPAVRYSFSMKSFQAGLYLLRLDSASGSTTWKITHH